MLESVKEEKEKIPTVNYFVIAYSYDIAYSYASIV